jgi:hypothetical protein
VLVEAAPLEADHRAHAAREPGGLTVTTDKQELRRLQARHNLGLHDGLPHQDCFACAEAAARVRPSSGPGFVGGSFFAVLFVAITGSLRGRDQSALVWLVVFVAGVFLFFAVAPHLGRSLSWAWHCLPRIVRHAVSALAYAVMLVFTYGFGAYVLALVVLLPIVVVLGLLGIHWEVFGFQMS